MNEKSKQEAEESADKWIKWAIDHKALTYWNSFVEGYLAGAEPREKRIAELEAQIEKMKKCNNCKHHQNETYDCRDFCYFEDVCKNHDKWEIKEK